MNLALFDFDGTITTKDSLVDFLKFAVGKPYYFIGLLLLSPVLLAYKVGFISNDTAKEILITHFFKDWRFDRFKKIADQYSVEKIDKIIRPIAFDKIRWHQDQGHKVVIVSASIDCWLKKWCKNHNIDLIATKLEVIEGKVTGKFAGKNCKGIEKVKRIKERYNLSEYIVVFAYGNSAGDKEMLSIADKQYYRCF